MLNAAHPASSRSIIYQACASRAAVLRRAFRQIEEVLWPDGRNNAPVTEPLTNFIIPVVRAIRA